MIDKASKAWLASLSVAALLLAYPVCPYSTRIHVFHKTNRYHDISKIIFSTFCAALCKNDESPIHQAFHSVTHPFPHDVEISGMEFQVLENIFVSTPPPLEVF